MQICRAYEFLTECISLYLSAMNPVQELNLRKIISFKPFLSVMFSIGPMDPSISSLAIKQSVTYKEVGLSKWTVFNQLSEHCFHKLCESILNSEHTRYLQREEQYGNNTHRLHPFFFLPLDFDMTSSTSIYFYFLFYPSRVKSS